MTDPLTDAELDRIDLAIPTSTVHRLTAEARRLRAALKQALVLLYGSEPPNLDGAVDTLLGMRAKAAEVLNAE